MSVQFCSSLFIKVTQQPDCLQSIITLYNSILYMVSYDIWVDKISIISILWKVHTLYNKWNIYSLLIKQMRKARLGEFLLGFNKHTKVTQNETIYWLYILHIQQWGLWRAEHVKK